MNKKGEIINFYNLFCKKNTKYFGGWYISCDKKQITNYFKVNPEKQKDVINLFFFLESLEILRKQARKKKLCVAQIFSKILWYHVVLLLLIGLIDQYTKKEKVENKKGELKIDKLGNRFLKVMAKLNKNEKKDIQSTYCTNKKKLDTFIKVAKDIYRSRTFFAHEVDKIYNNTPDDNSLSFSEDKKLGYILHPNLPYGKLFIYIFIALLRYIGFNENTEAKTFRVYEKLSDFASDSV